jgi:glycosidase
VNHRRPRARALLPWLLLIAAVLAFVSIRNAGASSPPEGWHHGAFAEIYVRGYRDSDGDGIGDLRGLTASLDYLQALGVRGLWLMPVTRSQDHDHGYAVADYRDIEPAYGTLADFDELLRQAHARGMGVVVDYVLNHSAAEHPAFVASRDPASPYRHWYVWQDADPGTWTIFGKSPWNATPGGAYLSQFSPSMPDFDLRNEQVLRFHEDNLRFWLDRGVDGFRFDAVTHLVENGPTAWNDQPESRAVAGRMRSVVDAYPNRFVVCEAVADPAAYARPDVCGHAFAIGHAREFLAAARGDRAALRRVAAFPAEAGPGLATLLSNHDAFAGARVADQLADDDTAYRLAAAMYLLQPGTPFIYYGEEIGLANAPGVDGDRALRVPMAWTGDPATAGFTTGTPFRALAANAATRNVAAEQDDPGSLLAWYRTLLALRNAHPALARGDYRTVLVRGRTYAFARSLDGERLLVVMNTGRRTSRVALQASWELEPLLPAKHAAHGSRIFLEPGEVGVYRVRERER